MASGPIPQSTVPEKSAVKTEREIVNPELFGPLFIDGRGAPGVSTNKAKKVMDWFRKKSLARGEGAAVQSDKGSNINYGTHNAPAPNVIVTGTRTNGERFVDGQHLAAGGFIHLTSLVTPFDSCQDAHA